MSEPGFIINFFDKSYENKNIEELVKAPVASISGVSEPDSVDLNIAFNIDTVEDLAMNKYVLLAQGINCLSACADEMEETALDLDLEGARDLAEQPVSTIEGVSASDAALLKKAFGIDNIRELAENKYVAIAQATVNLSKLVKFLKDVGVI